MNTARLNRRLTLQKPMDGKGGMGQGLTNWIDVITVWAEIKPAKAAEAVTSGAVFDTVTHDIRLHYRLGVAATMRLQGGGRSYDIIEPPINELEQNRYLLCKCREVIISGD